MVKVIDGAGKTGTQVIEEVRNYIESVLNHGTVSYTEEKASSNWYEPDNQGEVSWVYEGGKIAIINVDFENNGLGIPDEITVSFDVTDDLEVKAAAQWQDDNIWELTLA